MADMNLTNDDMADILHPDFSDVDAANVHDSQSPDAEESQAPASNTQETKNVANPPPRDEADSLSRDDAEAGAEGDVIRESVEDHIEKPVEEPPRVAVQSLSNTNHDPEIQHNKESREEEGGSDAMVGMEGEGQEHEIEDEGQDDSLFIPFQRRAPSTSDFSARPSASPAPSSTSSAIPSSSAQSFSSRMAPPTVPASRATAKSSTSTFSKIRNLQKRLLKGKVAATRPKQHVQPMPDGETYLDAILSHVPDRQASVDISTGDRNDKEERDAQAKYQKKKQHYDAIRQKNGKLSFAEDVAWMKIHSAETSRKRKRMRDLDLVRQENGEADLFPDVFGPGIGRGDNDRQEDLFDDDPAGSSRAQGVSSRRILPSMIEAELHSMQVALHAEGEKSSKKRKGARMPEKAQGIASVRSQPKTSKSKSSSRKPTKDKKAAEQAKRLHSSLLHSDVFYQQASEDAPEQPTFTSRNKANALKELIASIPNEHQKSAKDDTAALLRATKDFDGRGACRPDGKGGWMVKGMASPLKHYQVMGTAFMRRRENSDTEPRGGLDADQMGLGKTVMMLANIVNGRGNNDAECKTTLIIASPALLTQWGREIELHTDCGLVVMRYGSGSRIDSTHAFEIIKHHDIVLTTYHEILKSYPNNEPPIKYQTAEQKIAWWKETYKNARGPLHRIMFHRIVLDEAQAIKNHQSKTSIACRALMARHKWAMSGTPILNSLDELYSYFKFLGVPHTGNFKIFKHNYTDPKHPDNIERLLVRLSQFMIRRDHSDMMMNAPILKLPRASQMTHWCNFNSVERSIYEIVRQRFAKRINMSSQTDGLEKSYNNALVMLLRLRQLTAHILMLESVAKDLLEQEDIERIREVVQQEATDKHSQEGHTIWAIRKQLDHLEAEAKKQSTKKATNHPKSSSRKSVYRDNADEEQHDIEELFEDSQKTVNDTSGRTFGKNFDFRPYLNSLTQGDNWEKVKERAECSDCSGRLINPWLTDCGHLLCAHCYDDATLLAASEDRINCACKGCGSIFTRASQILQDEADAMMSGRVTRSKKRQHAREVQRIEQEDIAEDWLTLDREGVLPSAKTIALKAQLLNWITENPDVKIIIYTQFLAMITIMGRMCQEEGWRIEEYHGKMSQGARDKAIIHFAEDRGVRVLLASLRCGGLGLNLTMASRVVILDPWWNSAAEQQAFCRVFRFGQTESTILTRFCVKNSVDERLIQMQERKEEEIDSVMKEDAGAVASKMGIRDLMRLFGNLQDDDNGRPFILIDDADPRGGFHADRDHEGYADEL